MSVEVKRETWSRAGKKPEVQDCQWSDHFVTHCRWTILVLIVSFVAAIFLFKKRN